MGISVEDSSGHVIRGFAKPQDVLFKEPATITHHSFPDANASALNPEDLEGLIPQIQSIIKKKGSIHIYYFEDPRLLPDRKFLNSARLLSVYHFIKTTTNKSESLNRRKIRTYLLPQKPGAVQGEISILFFDRT